MKVLILCTTDSMIWNFLVPHIIRLEKEGCQVSCAASETGFFYKELIDKGIQMNKIPFSRSPYSFSNISAYKKLCALVQKEKYDVIFCHEPVGGAMGRIVGNKYGCRVVYMAHGFHFYKGAPRVSRLYYWVEKILSKKTDLLITINQEDYLASKKFYANKTALVNGIGVDTNKFKNENSDYLRKTYNLPDDAIILLSVGELIPRKNHLTIIEAMKSFKGESVYYFIAGDGPLEGDYHKKIEFYHLHSQVYLLGFCRNINDLCNSCDIYVFPSVQEGLSLALMEAMACAKPIVASRIRGNVDLIKDDEYLVDTYDRLKYVDVIRRLINDSKLRESVGKKNKEIVANFDTSIIEDKLVDLILK